MLQQKKTVLKKIVYQDILQDIFENSEERRR